MVVCVFDQCLRRQPPAIATPPDVDLLVLAACEVGIDIDVKVLWKGLPMVLVDQARQTGEVTGEALQLDKG